MNFFEILKCLLTSNKIQIVYSIYLLKISDLCECDDTLKEINETYLYFQNKYS